MYDFFRSDRLIQAVSFANDAPQCTGEERDHGSKLSLSFAITAGGTVDSKGASTSLGLAQVFRENGIHVIGIQEGRASRGGRIPKCSLRDFLCCR